MLSNGRKARFLLPCLAYAQQTRVWRLDASSRCENVRRKNRFMFGCALFVFDQDCILDRINLLMALKSKMHRADWAGRISAQASGQRYGRADSKQTKNEKNKNKQKRCCPPKIENKNQLPNNSILVMLVWK